MDHDEHRLKLRSRVGPKSIRPCTYKASSSLSSTLAFLQAAVGCFLWIVVDRASLGMTSAKWCYKVQACAKLRPSSSRRSLLYFAQSAHVYQFHYAFHPAHRPSYTDAIHNYQLGTLYSSDLDSLVCSDSINTNLSRFRFSIVLVHGHISLCIVATWCLLRLLNLTIITHQSSIHDAYTNDLPRRLGATPAFVRIFDDGCRGLSPPQYGNRSRHLPFDGNVPQIRERNTYGNT